MIVDGNYVFLDFEKVKPFIIDVFCKYYGYENEEEIKIKLDNITYHGWHDYRCLVDNYNIQLNKYRNEVIEEFYNQMGIENNDLITKIIFPEDKPIVENMINIACEGGENIDLDFMGNSVEEITRCRRTLADLFSIKEDKDYFENLLKIKKCLNSAMNVIEEKHPCDVFRECRFIFDSKRDVYKKYLKSLKELGFDIYSGDEIYVNREDFDDSSIYDMDSHSIYFSNEFLDEGIVSCFLKDDEEINDYGILDRYEYLMCKMHYLIYCGIDLKYIEDLSDIPCNERGFRLLNKEYEYQKSHYKEIEYFAYEDDEERKREWEKGNFIPMKLAQAIENIRNELQDELFFKCKNFDNYKRCQMEKGAVGLTSFHFNEKDGNKPYFNIYVNEDAGDNEFTLSTLIHEINHVMGFYPLGMGNENYLNCKEGLSVMAFNVMNKLDQEINYWEEDEDISLLQENINQRLARELTELFLQYYKNPYENNEMKADATSSYEDYDFITEDFYEAAKLLLRKNILAKTHRNLYYDSFGYYENKGIIGTLARKIKEGVYKYQDENRHKYSVKDTRSLGALISYFEKEVMYYKGVADLSPKQIENGDYKKILDKEGAARLEYILKERTKIKKMLENKGKEPFINIRSRKKNNITHEK